MQKDMNQAHQSFNQKKLNQLSGESIFENDG